MNTRICYQQSVTSGQPMPLTKEIWDGLIDSPEVKNICDRIAALDPTAEDYNDRKQALKKRLPILIPHAGILCQRQTYLRRRHTFRLGYARCRSR